MFQVYNAGDLYKFWRWFSVLKSNNSQLFHCRKNKVFDDIGELYRPMVGPRLTFENAIWWEISRWTFSAKNISSQPHRSRYICEKPLKKNAIKCKNCRLSNGADFWVLPTCMKFHEEHFQLKIFHVDRIDRDIILNAENHENCRFLPASVNIRLLPWSF